jgi:hypothetical protein
MNNIFDVRWRRRIVDSILITVKEAEKVFCNVSLRNKVIVVFHLTNFISIELLSTISKELKYKIMRKTQEAFLDFYNNNNKELNLQDVTRYCRLAVENTYPKHFLNDTILNLCHPLELIEYSKHGINTTLDLSHYQLYSNCLLYDKDNLIGNLDKELYGYAPSWKECLRILGDSLVQVHINDAKGIGESGEGLPLKEGEIPIVDILNNISSLDKTIQGTIEITEGHLHNEKLQKQGADWLLTNIKDVFG